MTPATALIESNNGVENDVFNPFEQLRFVDVKRLADELGVRRTVIADLRDRHIDPKTIPPEVIEKIPQIVKMDPDELKAHLESTKPFLSSHLFIYPDRDNEINAHPCHCITWEYATSEERYR